jgi:hypothetical protein
MARLSPGYRPNNFGSFVKDKSEKTTFARKNEYSE